MMRLRKEDVLVTERIGVNNDAQNCQILSFHPFFCFHSCATHSFALCSTGSQRGLVSCHVKTVPSLYLLSVVICQYQQGENGYHQQLCCRETLCWISAGTEKTCHSDTSHMHKSTHCSITAASHTLYTHKREKERTRHIHFADMCDKLRSNIVKARTSLQSLLVFKNNS